MEIIIPRHVVETILDYSRSAYPKEFFAYLKGDMTKNQATIRKVYYHPVLSTKKSVQLLPSLETSQHGLIGTAHSHPNGHLAPSRADLHVFSNFPANIICDKEKIRVFDKDGKEVHYKISEESIKLSEEDELHAKIFIEAINERQQWVSSYQSSLMMIVFAILVIIMTLVFSFRLV